MPVPVFQTAAPMPHRTYHIELTKLHASDGVPRACHSYVLRLSLRRWVTVGRITGLRGSSTRFPRVGRIMQRCG